MGVGVVLLVDGLVSTPLIEQGWGGGVMGAGTGSGSFGEMSIQGISPHHSVLEFVGKRGGGAGVSLFAALTVGRGATAPGGAQPGVAKTQWRS